MEAGADRWLTGGRYGKELKHYSSSHSTHACAALDSLAVTGALFVRGKDQGAATGSGLIVFPAVSAVNSQRLAIDVELDN